MRNVLEYLEAAYLKAPEKTAYASKRTALRSGRFYMQARVCRNSAFKDGLYKSRWWFLWKKPADDTAFLGVV